MPYALLYKVILERPLCLVSASDRNLAVGRSRYVLVYGDRAYLICHDAARCRILDVGDASSYVGLQRAVFKGAVAVGSEGAVFQHEVMGIAQRLLTRDVAIDETQVARVPSEILAVEL